MTHYEAITKWIEALRSGKFKQGTMWLRRGVNYCCLGVGCEIVAPGKFISCNNFFGIYEDGVFLTSTLSSEMRGLLGITQDQQTRLWTMNDSEEKTFPQIADWIEQNILPRYTNEDGATTNRKEEEQHTLS